MARKNLARAPFWTLIAGLIAALAATAAWADVTITERSTSNGLGGIMNTEGTSTESYKGDMHMTESESRMTNKVIGFLGGGKPTKTTSVVRLDKGVMWEINHKDKTYTEMTFAQMRAMMDSLGRAFAGAQGQAAAQKPQIDTSKVTFSPPTFEVKKTGKSETIAGYNCEQSIMTMTTEGTDKKTGDKMKLLLTMDMMLTPNSPAAAERERFGRKMAEAMGSTMDKSTAQPMMGMMGAYGVDLKKLAGEMEKMKGFPMRSVMAFHIEGKQFDQPPPTSEGKSQESPEASNKSNAKTEETPSNPSDAAKKALGGLFGKKKDKEAEKPAESKKTPQSAPPPDNALFSFTTEVTAISTDAVAGDRFEIPAGYKKAKSAFEK
ncbi:MAG: hypothetical protein HY304_08705 [candidate division Zixibacteria bacterium]|nr:hypothetical protein [candidate division Zixibacteria bacterium]